MEKAGYRIGNFWKQDFEQFQPNEKFDVVASFGFIEHFNNFEEILKKHAALVKSSGYLVVEVPNFFGAFQHWLHVHFDKNNYARHYIPAMNVERLAKVIHEEGYEILYKGYFGALDFWTEHEERGFFEKSILTVAYRLRPILKKMLPVDQRIYSPFCGLVARRQADTVACVQQQVKPG